MFQPAEEQLAGALDMIEAGILENPQVDAAMALHIMSGMPHSHTGAVTYCKGPALYSGDAVRITVLGKDAHGSTPEAGVDAINIAAHIVIALQEILAREIPCTDHAVLIVGKIEGGTTCNTLAGTAVLEASVRAITRESRDFIKRRIQEISQAVAATYRGRAEVEFVYGMPPLVTDVALSEELASYCAEVAGGDMVHEMPTSNGSEDFTAVAERVPSAVCMLGVGSIDEGHTCSMHNPGMLVNESALAEGAALYANCAARYLEAHSR